MNPRLVLTAAVEEPVWLRWTVVPEEDRALAFVYLVARRTGRSPASAARLCTRLMSRRSAGRVAGARNVRASWSAELRVRLRRRRGAQVFDEALADAMVLDELALLPPRQRFAVWEAVIRHRKVTDIAEDTGWTRGQAGRLLHAGMSSLATRVKSGQGDLS